MADYLYALSAAILLASFLTYLIIKISDSLKVFDAADWHRKKHKRTISRLGGIGVFLTFQISVWFLINGDNLELSGIMSASGILFIMGLKDDLLGNALPFEKFLMQVFAVAIILFSGDQVPNLLFPAWSDQLHVTFFSILMGCFMVFVINSFNLIDGVDGLAGVIGIIVNLFLAFQLFTLGCEEFALVGFVFTGALIGFLRFNILERRIFLGDSGAMLIGVMSVFLGIQFIRGNAVVAPSNFSAPFALLFSLLVVPMFDSVRILLIRCFHRKPLLKGDRNHIHHRLIDLGCSDFQVVLLLTAFTLIVTCFVLSFQYLGNFTLIVAVFVLAAAGSFLITYFRGKRSLGHYSLKDVILKDTFNIKQVG